MTPQWSKNNFESASAWIAEREDEARTAVIIKTRDGVTAVLPGGMAAFGTGFHGCLMFSPLPVFMAILLLVPLLGITGGWPLNWATIIISAGCLALIGGLLYVTRLLTSNRDLFPRTHFVTLGDEGIAMHFSRLNYPYRNPKAAIAWKDIKLIERKIMPATALPGIFPKTALEVVSINGERVAILLNFPPAKLKPALEEIETIIREFRKQ